MIRAYEEISDVVLVNAVGGVAMLRPSAVAAVYSCTDYDEPAVTVATANANVDVVGYESAESFMADFLSAQGIEPTLKAAA